MVATLVSAGVIVSGMDNAPPSRDVRDSAVRPRIVQALTAMSPRGHARCPVRVGYTYECNLRYPDGSREWYTVHTDPVSGHVSFRRQ